MTPYWLLFALLIASPLSAIDAIYLSWQSDPTSTMTIHWLTDDKDEQNEVRYKKEGGEEQKCNASHSKLPEVPYNVHAVELTGLEPDAIYHFSLPGQSEPERFRTMPKELSQPIRFAVGGDVYPDELEPFEQMAKMVATKSPRFVLLGGDIAYSVSDKKKRSDDFTRWLSFLQSWTRHMKDASNCRIPLLPAIGNHEVIGYFGQSPEQAKYYYALFRCPGPQGYKALFFNKYLFIAMLDSNHTHPISGQQSQWLESELKKTPGMTHRFAIYHVPAYPSVRYFRSRESCSIRRHWVPLFEKYWVHAVFENHDHAYKRTHPLLDGHVDPFGVVYFGDGSWGAHPRIPKKASWTSYLAKTKSRRQFILVTLDANTRKFESITAHDHLLDSYMQQVGKPAKLD